MEHSKIEGVLFILHTMLKQNNLRLEIPKNSNTLLITDTKTNESIRYYLDELDMEFKIGDVSSK
jgi:hypothetical protein